MRVLWCCCIASEALDVDLREAVLSGRVALSRLERMRPSII